MTPELWEPKVFMMILSSSKFVLSRSMRQIVVQLSKYMFLTLLYENYSQFHEEKL